MLEGYSFKDISHILTPVSSGLHVLENLAPLDELFEIGGVIEEFALCRTADPVRHIFQAVNFNAMLKNLLQFVSALSQLGNGSFHFSRRLHHYIRQFFSPLAGLVYFIDKHGVSRRMDKVGNIIHAVRQHRYIFPVKWGNEGAVQQCHNLMGNGVTLVFQVGYLTDPIFHIFPGINQLFQPLGGFYHVSGAFLKKSEELIFPGKQGKLRHCSFSLMPEGA